MGELKREAEALACAGSLGQAEELYRAILATGDRLDPEMRADVLNDLAVIAVNRGEAETALSHLHLAVESQPFHRQSHLNLIELEELLGRRRSSQELYDYLMRFFGSNEYAKSYISVHLSRFAEMLAALGRGTGSSRLLELGANTYFSLLLRRFTEFETRHTDFWIGEPEKVLSLRTLDGSETVEIPLFNFNAERDRYPFADESFDVAVVAELVEHLSNDPMFMMHELNRVLKSGGVLLLTTPNITSLRSVHAILNGCPPYMYNKFSARNGGRHCKEYAPSEVALLFERSGFIVDKIDTPNVWIESEPVTRYWRVYEQTLGILKNLGAGTGLRGEDIFAVGRKISAPVERYPVELYD